MPTVNDLEIAITSATILTKERRRLVVSLWQTLALLLLTIVVGGSARAQYLGFVANPAGSSTPGTVSVFAIVSNGPTFGPDSSPFQDHVIATVNVGVNPVSIAVMPSPPLNKAYVTNQDGSLWVIDVTNIAQGAGGVTATNINPQPANPLGLSQPGGIAIAKVPVGVLPNGGKIFAFIENQNQNTVSVIDLTNNSPTPFATVSLGSSAAGLAPGATPEGVEVAATADGKQVFVTNNSGANCTPPSISTGCPGVWMIDAASVAPGTLATRILTGTGNVTAASLNSTVATLTMGLNPITAGFIPGSAIQVSGFSGADTYFNGSFTVSTVSSTQITYSLSHPNGIASSKGSVTGGIASTAFPVMGLTTLQATLSGVVHTILGVSSFSNSDNFIIDLTGGVPGGGGAGALIPVSSTIVTSGVSMIGFCGPGLSPQPQPCAEGSTLNFQLSDSDGGINWVSGNATNLLTGQASELSVASSGTPFLSSLAVTPDGLFTYITGGGNGGAGNPMLLYQNSVSDGLSLNFTGSSVIEVSNGSTGLAISALDPNSAPVSWFLRGYPSCDGTLISPTTPISVTCKVSALGETMAGPVAQSLPNVATALNFGTGTSCTAFSQPAASSTGAGNCTIAATSAASVIGGMTTCTTGTPCFPAGGVYTVTLTGCVGATPQSGNPCPSGTSGTAAASVSVGASGCVLQGIQSSLFVGQSFTPTIGCTAPAGDALTGTVTWSVLAVNNSSAASGTANANNTATLTLNPATQFYKAAGTSQISATVTDTTESASAAAITPVSVTVNPPSCTLTPSPNPVQAGRTVTVTLACMAAPTGDSLSGAIVNWKDNSAGSGPTSMSTVTGSGSFTLPFTHIYSTPGSYTVQPSVTDSLASVAGVFASVPAITVVSPTAVVCSALVSPTKVKVGGSVNGTLTCAAQTGDVLSGTITWGDGNTTTVGGTSASGTATLAASHTYSSANTFSVTATATDTSLTPNVAATFSTTLPISVLVATPPSCTLAAPTSGQTGISITATLVCTAPSGDAISGTVNWGDNSSTSTVMGTGSATLTFTHTYTIAGSPTFSIGATIQDTTTTLSGTVNPVSVTSTIVLTPIVSVTTPPTAIVAGQSEMVPVKFAGGTAEAGDTLAMTCSVSPIGPTCSVSPTSLKLDASGNGTVQVTFNAPASNLTLTVPQKGDRQTPLFAYLLWLPALGLAFLSFSTGTTRQRRPWGLALLLIAVTALLSMDACTSVQRSNLTTLQPFAVTVTGTSATPSFTSSGVFTINVTE